MWNPPAESRGRSRVKEEVKAWYKNNTHLHEEEECFRFIHVSDEERTQSENTTAVLIQVRLNVAQNKSGNIPGYIPQCIRPALEPQCPK